MTDVQSRFAKAASVVAGLALVAGVFQNCSQAKFTSPGTASSDQSSTANSAGSSGSTLSTDGAGSIQATVSSFTPALAVRSANCINCHGNQLNSNLVTDFGHGDDYFFARNNATPLAGDWVYALRLNDDSNHLPKWAAAQQYAAGSQIIVPKANLGFRYADLLAPGSSAGAWLYQTTLGTLLTAIGQLPGAESTPVTEVSGMYIGVPGPTQLRESGKLGAGVTQTYFKDQADSLELSGLVNNGDIWTNAGTVTCDGDVFIDGTVFLNALVLKTNSGCRIQATGPIFLQKAVTYVGGGSLANLQLLSSRLISLGVGNTHCESNSNPGWYNDSHVSSPALMRFSMMADQSSDQFKDVRTRNTNPGSSGEKTASSPLDEGNQLLSIAQSVPGLEDASCHGRNVAFAHLMLIAPQVHSRYTGALLGSIIAEFPLMSLAANGNGGLSFTFDPIFKSAKVMPMIPAGEILTIQN